MKTTGLPKPVNSVQQEFLNLCEKGGGRKGGPTRGQVQELLRAAGKKLNIFAYEQASYHLSSLKSNNPWHVCFAIGMSWGHLAKLDLTFTEAASNLISNWNSDDLKVACKFHLERGPDPIRESLSAANQLFGSVSMPVDLPDTLAAIAKIQNAWLKPILSPNRPKYIGSWNATAMFMVALFAQQKLAKTLISNEVLLPPGGPVFLALKLLNDTHVLNVPPDGSQIDDGGVEGGVLFNNNEIIGSLLIGMPDWSMLDVHSGLYMLGTRDQTSQQWAP